MSKSFGIDNDGGGFELDDDDSIEELMRIASSGEVLEDGEMDTSFILTGETSTNVDNSLPEPIEETIVEDTDDMDFSNINFDNILEDEETTPNTQETNNWGLSDENEEIPELQEFPEIEDSFDTKFDDDDSDDNGLDSILTSDSSNPDNYVPQFTEETIEEELKTSEEISQIEEEQSNNRKTEETITNHPNTESFAKVSIRKESEYIEEATRIIAALDTYRAIDSESRSIVAQFIYNDNEVDPDDESTLVVKALRADPMLEKTMVALQDSATEKDRVLRVFYILELPQDVLYSLGDLVGTFTNKEIPQNLEKIPFSKLVEEGVEGLDDKIISYVTATRNVLEAARSGKKI